MDFINHQLFIKDINVHIDPILPKKIVIITHGHADHARFGHDHVIATRQTIDIMKIRYGDKCAKKFTPLRYGQKYSIKNYDFILFCLGLMRFYVVLGTCRVFFAMFGSFSIISHIFDPGIFIFIFKRSIFASTRNSGSPFLVFLSHF